MQKGGREKSRPVFLGENRDSLAASKSPPFENREGRGIPLLKHDLLKQFRTDDFAYLLALFCDLLRLLFATHDLVTHRLAFGGQAVHGSVILVFDRKSNVPILRTTVCFLEEDLVIDDRSRTFFLLEQWLGGLTQAG